MKYSGMSIYVIKRKVILYLQNYLGYRLIIHVIFKINLIFICGSKTIPFYKSFGI